MATNDVRPNTEQARKASRCMQGLAHELRLGILFVLRSGEKSVNALAEEIGSPQPTLSQHLGLMRERGILSARRDGNQVFYRVSDARIFKLLDLMKAVFCE